MKARQASFARCTPVDIIAGGHDDHITAKLSDTSEVSIHSDAMCAEMLLWISRIETDSGPRCAHAWRQDYRESPRCFGILGLFLSPGLWCRVLGLSLSLSLPGMRTGQSPRASCPPEVFSGRRGRKTNLSLSLCRAIINSLAMHGHETQAGFRLQNVGNLCTERMSVDSRQQWWWWWWWWWWAAAVG